MYDKNLINMRIDFGEKIKAWFNKCNIKAAQIIEKRSNDLY